ncbi:MAG: hypothetical protein ACSW8H_09585, partial [bacterium]
ERDKNAEKLANADTGESEGLVYIRRDVIAILKCVVYGCLPVAVAVVTFFLLFGKKEKRYCSLRSQ